jgi:hypothetical protein
VEGESGGEDDSSEKDSTLERQFAMRDQEQRDRKVSEAMDNWAGQMAGVQAIQAQADSLATTGQRLDPETYGGATMTEPIWAERAEALMDGIGRAPADAPELWRGITPYEHVDYEPGSTVEFSLGSFSTNRETAERLTSQAYFSGKETPVLFRLEEGAQALDVQRYVDFSRGWRSGMNEHEWVTGGTFEVTSAETTTIRDTAGDPVRDVLLVGLKQTDAIEAP